MLKTFLRLWSYREKPGEMLATNRENMEQHELSQEWSAYKTFSENNIYGPSEVSVQDSRQNSIRGRVQRHKLQSTKKNSEANFTINNHQKYEVNVLMNDGSKVELCLWRETLKHGGGSMMLLQDLDDFWLYANSSTPKREPELPHKGAKDSLPVITAAWWQLLAPREEQQLLLLSGYYFHTGPDWFG